MNDCSSGTRCLFGGTILAAGLMTQVANAQATFDLSKSSENWADAETSDQNQGHFYGEGPWFVSATSNDGLQYGASWGNTTSIGSSASSAGQGWGQGRAFNVYFVATDDGTVTASWDFAGDQTYGGGLWFWENGRTVFEKRSDGSAGTATFNVQGTGQYAARCISIASDGAGASHAIFTIPAPGTVALFGIAGIAASQRRQRWP